MVTASPCHTLNPVLMRWVDDHGTLGSVRAWMVLLPIRECVLPVFLSELRQNFHDINTKVDNYGMGMGSREPTEVAKHLGHLSSLGGPRGILLPYMTHRGILILGLLRSHFNIIIWVITSAAAATTITRWAPTDPSTPGGAPPPGMSPPPCISLRTSPGCTTGGTG